MRHLLAELRAVRHWRWQLLSRYVLCRLFATVSEPPVSEPSVSQLHCICITVGEEATPCRGPMAMARGNVIQIVVGLGRHSQAGVAHLPQPGHILHRNNQCEYHQRT